MSSWAIIVAASLLAVPQASENVVAAIPNTSVVLGPAEGYVRLDAAMPVDIEIAEPVGSNINHIDDMFAIRIGSPIMHDGKVLIPSGTLGRGQVVHAARSTGLGKAGELILAARYIDCGTLRIALRALRFESSGKDKSDQVFALSTLALPFMFMSGGAALVPVGTHATAKLSTTIDVPVTGCAVPVGKEGLPADTPIVATAKPAVAEKQK